MHKGNHGRSRLIACLLGLGVLLAPFTISFAQVTPDLNQLLQQFGPLLGLTGTGTTTTQPSTPSTPTTSPGGTARQPTIGPDTQFNSVSGAALQARRPGIYVQNAHAVQSGQLTLADSGADQQPDSFMRETFDLMLFSVLDSIQGILTAINALVASLGGGTTTQPANPTLLPIPNAATSGQGTTVTIP